MSGKLQSANCPVQERTINGTRYTVTRLGWWAMLDALHRLEEILGPAASAAVGKYLEKPDALDLDLNVADIVRAIGPSLGEILRGLLHRATDRRGCELIEILGRQTSVHEGQTAIPLTQAAMDTWFSQHAADALPWMAFAAEVQFLAFFALKPADAAQPFGADPAPAVYASPNT
jgi:hypothetical protein